MTKPVRSAVTIVMAAKSEADKLKKKRRKAARTLLAESGQSGPSVSNRPRNHLVDGKLVSKLPFNANGDIETTGLLSKNRYGNPYSATSTGREARGG